MSSKMTLLQMTQNILSAMESDEVNSIGDTVESLQVAEEIRTSYDSLFSNYEWPSLEGFINLEALQDVTRPTYMKIPDNVEEIYWIQYNHGTAESPQYVEVTYLPQNEFFRRVAVYTQGQSPVLAVDSFWFRTDTQPRFWTTWDNNTIIFDSYNSSLDDTLQQSKALCWGRKTAAFELSDDFIPPIDVALFPVLLSEAKRMCFVNFKGVSNANEEKRSREQKVRLQKHLWRGDQRRPYNRLPDYGRRR